MVGCFSHPSPQDQRCCILRVINPSDTLVLSDRDVSFAVFWGQYQKYRKEMEDIGHAPTVEKEYEVLRKAVTNENLKSIVIKSLVLSRVYLLVSRDVTCCVYVRASPIEAVYITIIIITYSADSSSPLHLQAETRT